MKNQRVFCYVLVFTCLIACQLANSTQKETPKASFVANPIPLEKQEVKTLEIGATAPDKYNY